MKNIYVLNRILSFLVYSNIYLSFGASIVAIVTLYILDLPFDFQLLFIPFAGGMFIYNINRYTDKEEDKINVPERTEFAKKYGPYIIGASIILYCIALYFAFSRNLTTLFVTLFPVLIGYFYSIKRLKRIFFLKNILVGLSWGITPLLVGFYYNIFSAEFFILATFFAITFFINTVIFDVKDIIGDLNMKINTIPIRMGLEKTKVICYASNFIALLLLSLSVLFGILPPRSLVLIPFLIYIFLYVKKVDTVKDGFFYGVLVDGEFIFLYFLVLGLIVLQI